MFMNMHKYLTDQKLIFALLSHLELSDKENTVKTNKEENYEKADIPGVYIFSISNDILFLFIFF